MEASAAPSIAVSASLELVYFVRLAAACSRAQLSVVYPVARGGAPVLVLLGAALALAALELAPAAPVAAVRETSMVVAVALAAPLLRERVGPARLAGAALVAVGVALLAA